MDTNVLQIILRTQIKTSEIFFFGLIYKTFERFTVLKIYVTVFLFFISPILLYEHQSVPFVTYSSLNRRTNPSIESINGIAGMRQCVGPHSRRFVYRRFMSSQFTIIDDTEGEHFCCIEVGFSDVSDNISIFTTQSEIE